MAQVGGANGRNRSTDAHRVLKTFRQGNGGGGIRMSRQPRPPQNLVNGCSRIRDPQLPTSNLYKNICRFPPPWMDKIHFAQFAVGLSQHKGFIHPNCLSREVESLAGHRKRFAYNHQAQNNHVQARDILLQMFLLLLLT